MQFSKRAVLILAEATATSVIGLVHAGAGVALTFGLAFIHIRFDRVPVQQQSALVQRVHRQVPIAPRVEEEKQE